MIRSFLLSLAVLAPVHPVFAENALTALPTPAERPYPYEILGLQPGDPLDKILDVFADRSDADPTSESDVLRIQSPEGAVFEFTYQRYSRIGDVGINGRLAGAAQDQVTAWLTSDVMEQRPVSIGRNIRQPSDQLPEPLALKAQIEETYGPPSRTQINGREMTLTYAWSTDGFIADLDAIGPITHEETRSFGGRETTTIYEYELCGTAQHYQSSFEYRFEYPRDDDIRPGCLATFIIRYRGDPGMTNIGFELIDYDLARQHQAELDSQIVEAFTSETVKASDMDL